MTSDGPQFEIIDCVEWSFAWQESMIEKADALRDAIDRTTRASDELSRLLGLTSDRDVTPERRALFRALAKRIEVDAGDVSSTPKLADTELRDHVQQLNMDLDEVVRQNRSLSASYSEDQIKRMPLSRMDEEWRQANTRLWPFSVFARRRIRKLLQTYTKTGSAAPATDIPALIVLKTRLSSIQSNPVRPLAGEARSGERASNIVDQAIDLRRCLEEASSVVVDASLFGAAKAELEGVPTGKLRQRLEEWMVASTALASAAQDFESAGGTDTAGMALSKTLSDIKILRTEQARIADWVRWLDVRRRARQAGLGKLVDAVEAGKVGTDTAEEFRRAYARTWLRRALDASPALRTFAHWDHEDRIKTFRDLDMQAADLASAELIRRIRHELPASDDVPKKSELGVLRHQMGLQRPSMPIRTLLESLPHSFSKLAPCVLMSPLSIAQYLPAGQASFDLVIFDEASQISTWDAIGAIARGKQSIIVGDPKQLPPTNFFGRSDVVDDDGEDEFIRDMPSILDEVAAAGIGSCRLDWHYRSRDEALIAFSNHFYYGGGLVTFPAPSTRSIALQFHKIGGTYARGGGRTNADEAKAIATMVRHKLKMWLEWPEEKRLTLGVITFNVQQQALILDLLDESRRNDKELEWFFSDDREEPVIVKNLENIQGDERDVMLFSITFAPDAAGRFSMNFGPLNSDGGERRLNVAVTRARHELHVFSSIRHDQIDLSRTRAQGVHDLKTFLDYAHRGADALPAREEGSLGPAENPFEEAVAVAFRAKGWEVRTQIGVSGFRIDLGIVNPKRAGVYLAGIECDGASYHSSATARDRDKVRQAVLEDRGWIILRVWSTDWFRCPGEVVERLHSKLEEILQADQAARVDNECHDNEPEVDVIAFPSAKFVDDIDKTIQNPFKPNRIDNPEIPSSVFAEIGASTRVSETEAPDATRFFESDYLPRLREIVYTIVTQQGPLTVARLCREVARAHGWKRTGRRIKQQVRKAMNGMVTRDEFEETFVWNPNEISDRVPFRGLRGRPISEVSRTEIASALDELGNDLHVSDDPILELARKLGISRLSSHARAYLDKCIEWYCETKRS